MNRRVFIKGLIAAGVLLATPLEGLSEVFTRKYMTATEVIKKEEEFIRSMSMHRHSGKTDRALRLYIDNVNMQLQTPDIKWFSLEE